MFLRPMIRDAELKTVMTLLTHGLLLVSKPREINPVLRAGGSVSPTFSQHSK